MPRAHKVVLWIALVALSWYGMMAVHVIGAWLTGGRVERVVLHPLAIARTDLAHNPRPGVVVWLGPLVGCVLPLAIPLAMPRRWPLVRKPALFFAGFCLIANGAYISLGSFAAIGDCGEMFRTGTPHWVMLLFGAVTVPLGLLLWHRLGSLQRFLLGGVAEPDTCCKK
jgi:hypothetical protein